MSQSPTVGYFFYLNVTMSFLIDTCIQSSGSLIKEEAVDSEDTVEMVTFKLGSEWGKDEMHQMTKMCKIERRMNQRPSLEPRGERRCEPYFTRRVLVFFLSGLCCVYVTANPLVNATGSFATAVPSIFSCTLFSCPSLCIFAVRHNQQFLSCPICLTQH